MAAQTRHVTIDAPRDHVWSIVADLEAIADWNPSIKSASRTSQSVQGVGESRSCELVPTGSVRETVRVFEPERRFVIDIVDSKGTPGMRGGGADIQLQDAGPDRTDVTITMNYQLGLGPIGFLMDRLVMRRMSRTVLERMTAGLKHHAETGETVTADTPLPIQAVETPSGDSG